MPVDSQHETQRDVERTPLSSPDSLRVRCPHCRKLYLVQYADIQEAKPRFECAACHDRFWISLADMDFSVESEGLPLHVKEAPARPKSKVPAEVATEPCPKCFKLNVKGVSECAHCGVVLAKTRLGLDFKEPVPAHSERLEALWHQVISNYDMGAHHDEFLRVAHAEGNLAYAGAVYNQMLKLMPMDEISLARMKQVQALSEVLMPPREPRAQPVSLWSSVHSRVWQIPLLGGAMCIAVGMALPGFRNIAGVGAALLFLSFALKRR